MQEEDIRVQPHADGQERSPGRDLKDEAHSSLNASQTRLPRKKSGQMLEGSHVVHSNVDQSTQERGAHPLYRS